MRSSTFSLLLLAQRRRRSPEKPRTLDVASRLRQSARDGLRRAERPAEVVLSTEVMRELVR